MPTFISKGRTSPKNKNAILPVTLYIEAASPAEVTLAERTLENSHVLAKPFLVVADKTYDSDPLRERMADEDMILLAPHRAGRVHPNFNF